jgi:hypothetical protein
MEKWWKAMESYGNHTEMDWFKGKKKVGGNMHSL